MGNTLQYYTTPLFLSLVRRLQHMHPDLHLFLRGKRRTSTIDYKQNIDTYLRYIKKCELQEKSISFSVIIERKNDIECEIIALGIRNL